MVGQLVESNERWRFDLLVENFITFSSHTGKENFPNFGQPEAANSTSRNRILTSLLVVQIIQLIKFFVFLFVSKVGNFPVFGDNFSKLTDWLLRPDFDHFGTTVGKVWLVFRQVSVSRIRFFFFCFFFIVYASFCNCVKQLHILKVKMKALFERCLLSNYTLMEIFSVFNILCEIFCKFLSFLLIYFTLYWLLICW